MILLTNSPYSKILKILIQTNRSHRTNDPDITQVHHKQNSIPAGPATQTSPLFIPPLLVLFSDQQPPAGQVTQTSLLFPAVVGVPTNNLPQDTQHGLPLLFYTVVSVPQHNNTMILLTNSPYSKILKILIQTNRSQNKRSGYNSGNPHTKFY
jgi:hypothetical protein